MILTFDVHGVPAPKGSLKHVGNGRLVEQLKASGPWMTRVRAAALAAAHDTGWVHDGAGVRVEVEFVIPRPKTVRRALPVTRRADLDKLCRAVLDAITTVPPRPTKGKPGKPGLITDDSAVVDLVASKRYPAGDAPFIGARITLQDVAQ